MTPEKLWSEMIQIFGSRFTSSYGTRPLPKWAVMIVSLREHQVAHALKTLESSESDFPPTLGQFKKIAVRAPTPPDYSRTTIGHEAKEWTQEERKANKDKLGRLMRAAASGKLKGLSEAEIAEKLAGGEV